MVQLPKGGLVRSHDKPIITWEVVPSTLQVVCIMKWFQSVMIQYVDVMFGMTLCILMLITMSCCPLCWDSCWNDSMIWMVSFQKSLLTCLSFVYGPDDCPTRSLIDYGTTPMDVRSKKEISQSHTWTVWRPSPSVSNLERWRWNTLREAT